MDRRPEMVELFQALQVAEVEERAQHTSLGTNIGSSSSYYPEA